MIDALNELEIAAVTTVFAIVGSAFVVLQQNPFSVMLSPPSLTILPAIEKESLVTLEEFPVVTVGKLVMTLAAVVPEMLVQTCPLKTCISPLDPQLVHQIIRPATGFTTAVLCASLSRGGNNPLLVVFKSSIELCSGLFVPIPI